MPGSEAGDRVHNFFDQEKFSGQRSQVVAGSRLVSSGFHWPENQGHENSRLNFSPGHSASDPDRGNLDRQTSFVHSSPFLQSPQRPTFISSPHRMHKPSPNGYIYDHHLLHVKNDETEFMGMNRDSYQQNPLYQGLMNSGVQFRNLPEQHREARLETTESPVDFDFLGSHQQMNSRQFGMLQSSPRQHSGLNGRQMLQQQAMMKNLYEVQMQQQSQKQAISQINSVNILSTGQQKPNDRSPSNNTSFQDGPNFALMSQHRVGHPNGPQDVVSPVMQRTSNGMSFTAEQNTPSNIFGFSPQSVDHSFYGFPISNARGPSSHHSHNMEKPMLPSLQVPSEIICVPAFQNGVLLGQVSAQDREFGPRFGFQKSNNLKNGSSQVNYPEGTTENSPHVESQQRNPSLNSKENTLSETVISQDAAPLDPTEEQFLFGSDNNIWDAFGKNSDSKLDGYKMVEGSEFQNPVPSMQSGSWSALMQSALAETCSGATCNREEWSNLNLSGNPARAIHEPLAFSSSAKQKTPVINGIAHVEPSFDANHYLSLDNSRATYPHSMQGYLLSSLSGSSNENERFQLNSVDLSNQHIPEGNRVFDHGKLMHRSEDNHIFSKSSQHPAAALNSKGLSSTWDPQHGTPLNNIGNQAYKNSNQETYMGQIHGNMSPTRSTSNENIVHHRQDDHRRFMHGEAQKDKSSSQYSFLKSVCPIGKLTSNSNVATGPSLNSLQDTLNGSQNALVSQHFIQRKHDGSIRGAESENMSRYQHPPEPHPPVLDSSFSNSENKIQTRAPGDYSKHENYLHMQQSKFWENASVNRLLDTSVSSQSIGNLADEKHMASDQAAGSSPGLGLRQYQHLSPGQPQKSSIQNDKGKGSNLHKTSSVGLPVYPLPNNTLQPSQNMEEFLNKTGHSRESNAEASRNSSEPKLLSEKSAAESPDTSISHLQQNRFIGSQTYGLQLGPPPQRFPNQICGSLPSLSQAPSSMGLSSVQHEVHPSAASCAKIQKVLEHSSASISSGPNFGNQLQNQQACKDHMSSSPFMSNDTVISQPDHTNNMLAKAPIMQTSVGMQFNSIRINNNSTPLPSSSSQEDKTIQSNVGPRHVGFPGSWTSVPNQQNSSQPDIFTSQSHMKTSEIPPIEKDDQNPPIRGNDLPESGATNTIFTRKSSQQEWHAPGSFWKGGVPDENGLELKAANIPGKDGIPFSYTVSHLTHETSGNSVKTDAKPQNSYSLLHQLHVMRSDVIDQNKRDSKRQKVYSNSSDSQQPPSKFGQHQNLASPLVTEIGSNNFAVSGDSKLGKLFSAQNSNQGRNLPLQHGIPSCPTIPAFGQNDTQNSHNGITALSSTPLTRINPQMAPTWFERYGSLNREQLVPASDVWKHSLAQPLEVGVTHINSSTSFLDQKHVQQIHAPVVNEIGQMKHCSPPEHTVIQHVSSPQLMALTEVLHELETATFELVPWHKEVTQHGLQYLLNIGASGVKWANATKRIPEKVIDEVEHADNKNACKRRLVLMTQLMQQLLDPPPALVMSSDAYMNYESVVYFNSRVSCGTACSFSGSKIHCISSNHNNMTYVAERSGDLLSIENDFLVRASKLENSMSSLEKQTSIQELGVEWQDVEKFSIINRFAKFHGRGQADGPGLKNPAILSPNHGPQRYVTAQPYPRNLPDIVQCLSL